jgi:predicted PurR-regulated permease PerM
MDMNSESRRNGPTPVAAARSTADLALARMSLPPLVTIVGVTAILYLGRDVFLPFAIALLLTFALAPIVSFLRRRRVPRILAVIITVAAAFAFFAAFSFIVASQVSNLAQNISTYQSNIVEKVRSLREIGASGGLVDHVTRVIERVGQELRLGTQPAGPDANAPKPLPVEIVSQESPLDLLRNIVVPLISPFATAGLVLVVVIFMLLEREALRDRFIRLAGYGDLHTTTEALQDAGTRVGRYLLMQLVINTIYAIPIAGGLWLLGIPNALLWGLLTLVLRFVPYIGPAIGMLLPLLVTLAVTPGWAPLLWTAALFMGMELLSNNVLEPWLYGSHTGLSPLAIIVAAIFWAWLWGPLGLVLSTPLTVCLVVLGRHVPQFEFLNVLLGNEPVLEPHARVYQRLLAGDPDEAADYAEEYLEDAYLADFYDKVGIPALIMGEQDRQRGVMTEEKQSQFAAAALSLVDDLEEVADDEEGDNANGEEAEEDEDSIADDLPDGEGRSLLCMGGRGAIDDAAAVMLAQVMEVQGATVARALHGALGLTQLRRLELDGVDTVVLTYLNTASAAQARHAVRRLKRLKRKLRVGIFMPTARPDVPLPSAEVLNADFVASAIADAVRSGFAQERPVPLHAPPKRLSSRRAKPRKRAAAAA